MVARARGPTFTSPGPGQYRQLEARLAITLRRSRWSTAGSATVPTGAASWSQGSTDQPPPAAAAVPPYRPGCRTCGQQRCHSDFHRPRCYVCGHPRCHSMLHRSNTRADAQPPVPNVPNRPASTATGPARNAANPQSNWQRGSNQGERAPPASVPQRRQSH